MSEEQVPTMSDEDTRAMAAAIRNEVSKDPEGRGYKGKNDTEIAELLNESYEQEGVARPPRINTILVGIPFAPNVISAAEVKAAKKK